MAGREHCTLARIRGRYIIDMNAERRVTLDGWQLLDSGTPLPDSCELQIGPDGPRLKLLATRHSGMASTADQQLDGDEVARRASRPASEVDVAKIAETAGGSRKIGLAAGLVAVLAAVVGVVFFTVTQTDVEELQVADAEQDGAIGNLEGRADEMEDDLIVLGADLPEIMETARRSVYLVVIRDSAGGETGVGTAFTVTANQVATNSHVAKWLDELAEGETMVLRSSAMHGAPSVDTLVLAAEHHPGYAAFADLWRNYIPVRLNASKGVDAVRSAGAACDLALLSVAADVDLGAPLPLATSQHHAMLMPGHAVASIGYPMEGMAMEGVNVRQPVPQSQIGRITALTTFFNTSEDETDHGPGQRNILLQHSIPGTGGASGSPIINGAGEVVGVLSAVNFAIIDGQRIPTGVGVNYAQRATLLEELLDGTAAQRLPQRTALWDMSVKFLYHSGKLVRGTAGISALKAIWRRQVQGQVGIDKVVLTRNLAGEYFPLSSLEAGNEDGRGGGPDFDTDLEINTIGGHFYFLVAESDGTISLNLDDPDGLVGEAKFIPLGSGALGVTFRALGDGIVTGIVTTEDALQLTWSLDEGESVGALPSNLLSLARSQWRDDLYSRWGADVRDTGGLKSAGTTVSDDGDGHFFEVEEIQIPTHGRFMIAAIAPDQSNLDLRLYQIDGDNRTLLAEDVQQDWYPYLVVDTDFPVTLEAEIFADSADVEYDIYVYRAVVTGDTDADDLVAVPDLINVVLGFGSMSSDEEPIPADIDENGMVGVEDLLAVLGNFNAKWPLDAREQPKRLICMFTIGGSYSQGVAAIHPMHFNMDDGWQRIIDTKVSPLVDALGDGAFDWWGHNICGYWYDHDYFWASDEVPESMTFEQIKYARESIPSLADFSILRSFADGHDMELYAYVGQPRSYERDSTPGGMPFDTDFNHGNLAAFDEYYKELVDNRFIGLGHDASVHHPASSPWLTNMVPALKERGIDVFIESLPKRSHPHLLGLNVVAENRVWDSFGRYPEIWYTPDEIRAAGGRTLHLITWPFGQAPGDSGYDPDFDNHAWQFSKTKELLLEGQTVVCPLHGLHTRGYPLAELVEAARQTANISVE